MANVLTQQAIDDISYVVDYITRSGNGLERPFLDDKCYELLGRNYAAFDYDSQHEFLEDLRTRPHVTLLNVILFLSE